MHADGSRSSPSAGPETNGDTGARAGPTSPAPTFAQKVDGLFRTVHPRQGGEYTYDDVANAIRARGGPTISATYLYLLRKGQRDNPTKKHLEALAGFFGVAPAYFFDDAAAARIDAQLDLLVALRDLPVREIALRVTGLSPRSLATVREVIDRLRQLEGLLDVDLAGQRDMAHPVDGFSASADPGESLSHGLPIGGIIGGGSGSEGGPETVPGASPCAGPARSV